MDNTPLGAYNGLVQPCPKCGCFMESYDVLRAVDIVDEYGVDGGFVTELVSYCPCCEYTETTYED